MRDYLNEINDLFPIRRREEEKTRFYNYVKTKLGDDRVKIETLEEKHNNIVIGNISNAKVIFTAHYDTPAASPVPNLMLPLNKILGTVFHFLYPIVISLLSLFIAVLITTLTEMDKTDMHPKRV